MAALVQTISQTIPTLTMLQTRPATSSGPYSNQSRGSSPWGTGNTTQFKSTTTSSTGSAPYALNQIQANNQNPLRQHPVAPRPDTRSLSAPIIPTMQSSETSPKITDQNEYFKSENRLSLLNTSPLDLSLIDPRNNENLGTKHTPERYKRPHQRTETYTTPIKVQSSPSGSGLASVGHIFDAAPQTTSISGNVGVSQDDTVVTKTLESAKRYRRRSIATIGAEDEAVVQSQPAPQPVQQQRSWASVVSTPYVTPKPEMLAAKTGLRPSSRNGRTNSNESVSSSSSIKKQTFVVNTSPTVSQSTPVNTNQLRVVNIPPRGSSDASKRLNNSSPLSKPVSMGQDGPPTQSSFAQLVAGKAADPEPQYSPPRQISNIESPAQQHLTSLSKKDGKKEGKSRLRRAFSFGSAAELRKASAENSHAATSRKLQKPQYETEEEAREAAIVKQQEASGLGNSIYSGQGNVFSGSTDNLSVSSTASSASVMLRKMGQGMKKGTRSLVGLFRPKSIIGVPAADAAVPEPALAEVSMVTVEAEREKVNVNLHPSEQTGTTGYPKLERNSLDTAGSEPSLIASDRSSDGVKSRRSIVGSEKDRAEVLAAVKKGILKRAGTDSGSNSPAIKSPEGLPPPGLPRIGGSPQSSAPGTPTERQARGHRRTDSVTIEGEDYFIGNGPSFNGVDSKSLPGTPKGSVRNITFSPRIQFHDTWTASDYDRRGEIATCNRLTPSLAQAIKEELNTFKMEMEVHESSKVFTHFF